MGLSPGQTPFTFGANLDNETDPGSLSPLLIHGNLGHFFQTFVEFSGNNAWI